MAMRVASVVERYQIEPFEIRFNQWSIIPHAEAMEADWEALRNLPDADSGDPSESDRGGGVMDDDTENDDRVDHYDHDTNDDQMKYITSMQRRKKKEESTRIIMGIRILTIRQWPFYHPKNGRFMR